MPSVGLSPRLLAISDLHLGSPINREALDELPAYPDDWLIVAGDVAESFERIAAGLALLADRFAKVIWVPGNHELWSVPGRDAELRGAARYEALVALIRDLGVVTPEDPFPVWEGKGGPAVVAPLFTLYDYSFAPEGMGPDEAVAWAAAAGIRPVDEALLHAEPYGSRQAWCAARVAASEARLTALGLPTVLVNHYPLRRDLVDIPRIPRFIPWCGTRRTEDWHRRYRAVACVHGHLHVRGREARHLVPFLEVSLGYPRQWDQRRGVAGYLRQVLP